MSKRECGHGGNPVDYPGCGTCIAYASLERGNLMQRNRRVMETRFTELVRVARGLVDPGETNAEYERGMAELICDACNLSMGSRDSVLALFRDAGGSEVT